MTKEFYLSVCLSLGLTLAIGLFQSWLHFQLGIDLYGLASFRSWFFVADLTALLTAVLLLIYYHHKHFQTTFWTGLLTTVTSFAIPLYLILATLYPLLGKYPGAVTGFGVITNLIYGSTLALSVAGSRLWLKRTGIVMTVLYGSLLALLIWFMDTPPYPPNPSLDLIQQWLFLIERIVPVLLIVNFVDEWRSTDGPKALPTLPSGLLFARGMVVVLTICSVVLGIQLLGDSYYHTHISAREAALAQPFEQGSYISAQGDTLLYRLLKPLHYDPTKQYPLVVGLTTSCWSDNTRQIDACPMAKWLVMDENRRKYATFVFVPRCPPHSGWGGVANTPSVASLATEAILALNKEYSIDTHRRYITGVSRGGYGTWHLIGEHPELFAAAIPVCGEGNPSQASQMKSVSVWAFHGAKDMNVPVSGSRKMVSALKVAGGAPRYTEYPDAAHSIWEEVIKTPGLLDWLFTQKQIK